MKPLNRDARFLRRERNIPYLKALEMVLLQQEEAHQLKRRFGVPLREAYLMIFDGYTWGPWKITWEGREKAVRADRRGVLEDMKCFRESLHHAGITKSLSEIHEILGSLSTGLFAQRKSMMQVPLALAAAEVKKISAGLMSPKSIPNAMLGVMSEVVPRGMTLSSQIENMVLGLGSVNKWMGITAPAFDSRLFLGALSKAVQPSLALQKSLPNFAVTTALPRGMKSSLALQKSLSGISASLRQGALMNASSVSARIQPPSIPRFSLSELPTRVSVSHQVAAEQGVERVGRLESEVEQLREENRRLAARLAALESRNQGEENRPSVE